MVFIFFCVGIALGTYIVKYMRASDASDLTSYFSTFAQSIVKEPVNNKALLLNVLKKNLILLTVLITISFTVFGTPIILLLDLIKGFTLGYTFSFLISLISSSFLCFSKFPLPILSLINNKIISFKFVSFIISFVLA